MNFDFIEQLRLLLESSNIFKFTIIGAKSCALSLLLFKIIQTWFSNFEPDKTRLGDFFNLFGYAFMIMSSDWIISTIEVTFAGIDVAMGSTESDLYSKLNDELLVQLENVFGSDDLAWYDFISLIVGNLIFFVGYIIALLLMGLCKIADLSMTAGYLLSRLFLIELMKFIFPIVIALSTLDQTKDLLGRWIKKYIGLFVLGIAYIGIIHFCALVQNALQTQFTVNDSDALFQLNAYTYGMIVTIIVVFTIKVKLFSLVTSNITNFFS